MPVSSLYTTHRSVHSTMYSMNDSSMDKEERKREVSSPRGIRTASSIADLLTSTTAWHNENSVCFTPPRSLASSLADSFAAGRRRKEHLKNLEQSQKEQSSEKLEEIERLRYQNSELKRENEALKAQIYGSPTSQQHVLSAPLPMPTHHQQHDSRAYSLSPSLTGSHSVSSAGSPPAMMSNDGLVQMPGMSYSSSMIVPAMSQFSDHSSMGMMSAQPYSMVHPSGPRHTSQSSLESSEFGKPPRSAMGSSFQPVNHNVDSAEGSMWVSDFISVY